MASWPNASAQGEKRRSASQRSRSKTGIKIKIKTLVRRKFNRQI
jgi:hypothetical protein